MARKRARHEQISDERKRDDVFTKRVESLTEKANDLSVLCGVDIGIVVHQPAENNAVLWPSPEIFGERMQKFLDFSEMERGKKMVIHDEYVEERLDDEKGEMLKSQKKNLIESQLLMNELLMLKKLQIRDDETVTFASSSSAFSSSTINPIKKLKLRQAASLIYNAVIQI